MGVALRHGLSLARIVATAALAFGPLSTAYAGSAIKVVTAPSDSTLAADVPHADEPLPGEPPPGEPANPPSLPGSGTSAEIEAGQVVVLSPGTIKEVSIADSVKSVFSLDSNVVEAVPVTDHKVILKALKQGVSDVVFYNTNDDLVKRLVVTVDNYVYNRQQPSMDLGARPYNSVEVHNKSLLTSQTNFRCGPDGCHYIGELTVAEPAPLPKGYTNNTSTNTYSGLPSPAAAPPAAGN